MSRPGLDLARLRAYYIYRQCLDADLVLAARQASRQCLVAVSLSTALRASVNTRPALFSPPAGIISSTMSRLRLVLVVLRAFIFDNVSIAVLFSPHHRAPIFDNARSGLVRATTRALWTTSRLQSCSCCTVETPMLISAMFSPTFEPRPKSRSRFCSRRTFEHPSRQRSVWPFPRHHPSISTMPRCGLVLAVLRVPTHRQRSSGLVSRRPLSHVRSCAEYMLGFVRIVRETYSRKHLPVCLREHTVQVH